MTSFLRALQEASSATTDLASLTAKLSRDMRSSSAPPSSLCRWGR